MSLNYIQLSNELNNYYKTMKNNLVTDLQPNQKPYPANPSPAYEWVDNYINVYDTDANNGVFSATSVVMLSSPSTLRYIPGVYNAMAKPITDYWKLQLTQGAPMYDGIVSITNDAAKIEAPISAYLNSLTSTLKTPSYEHLFSYIETQVKTIIWTVTETSGTSTVTYDVVIS